MIRIGILNYADVRNFGDVLFPLVVKLEIKKRIPAANFTYITPTGSSWGGMTSTRVDAVDFESYEALILGGGEIVHRFDAMLNGIYAGFNLTSISCPTDLVFSWTHAKTPYKAWLGLGVPARPDDVSKDIAHSSLSMNFLGVRGSHSFQRVLASGVDSRLIRRTPDLGWLFPRLLNGKRFPAHPADGMPYIAIQALGFSDPLVVANDLHRFAEEMGLRIVLLPLTRCWNDVEPLRLLQAAGSGFFLVDDATADIDKLAILGGAVLMIGQSMHGFIGTISQNRPAGLIAPYAEDKFGELVNDSNLSHLRCPGWDGLSGLLKILLWQPAAAFTSLRKEANRVLDKLFDEICEEILESVQAG